MSNSSSSKISIQTRRKALLSIAAGATTSIWHKPIINSVFLPAHAQASTVTTPPTPTPPTVTAGPFFGTGLSGPTITLAPKVLPKSFSPIDLLIPQAHAGVIASSNDQTEVQALPTGTANVFTVTIQTSAFAEFNFEEEPSNDFKNIQTPGTSVVARFTDNLTVGGGAINITGQMGSFCDDFLLPPTLSVTLLSANESDMQMIIASDIDSVNVTVPNGSGSISPIPSCGR